MMSNFIKKKKKKLADYEKKRENLRQWHLEKEGEKMGRTMKSVELFGMNDWNDSVGVRVQTPNLEVRGTPKAQFKIK